MPLARLDVPLSGLGVERPLKKISGARASQKFVAFHDHASTRQYVIWHPCNLNALKHRIVDTHMVSLRADGVLTIRIEDHQIRVAAHGDRALARIQTEKLCRSGRNHFHKTIHAESSPGDTARINEAHAVLDAWTAVRDLGEVVSAQFFLLFETEGTVIGRHHLQMIGL